MDLRAEKLANARKKLRDHQEKKTTAPTKDIQLTDTKDNVLLANNDNNPNIMKNVTNFNSNEATTIQQWPDNFENESFVETCVSKKDSGVIDFLDEKSALEKLVKDLNTKIYQLELLHESEINQNTSLKDKVNSLQYQLDTEINKHKILIEENNFKDNLITQLESNYKSVGEDKNNFMEQLEVTKVMLKTKETENIKLKNEMLTLYNQLDATKLQIQQISNDTQVKFSETEKLQNDEVWSQKVTSLQQQIEAVQKEKENINSYYEQYVKELIEQLKNENLNKEKYYEDLLQLQQRESSLVEQISEMEIRLQSFTNIKEKNQESHSITLLDLQEKLKNEQGALEDIKVKYNELQKQYEDSLATIKSLHERNEYKNCDHDNISMSKLNADITSDKVALQKAIQQNIKLKQDVEDLELVVVKMTKDKLQLTEMLNHEKKLNKDLILKLSDIEESTKNMNNKLRAKDDEMIRLQSGYREIENKHGKLLQDLNSIKEKTSNICHENESHSKNNADNADDIDEQLPSQYSEDKKIEVIKIDDHQNIPKMEAMHKLQERFLKIMNEVAILSDEKQRLEHIITQLQNETDTICEYVALYQQQRSLLKKREEERNHQISLFQRECEQLKLHVDELRYIILQIIDDPKLTSYFENEGFENEIVKAKKLLDLIQNSCLVEARFDRLDLNIFYPCNCCSGKLIDV